MITVTNTVLRKWAKGKVTTNAWLLIGNTLTAEAVASMGFDSVTIDLQHGVINQEDVVPMVQAIAAARRQGPGGGGGGGAEGAAAAAAAPWARVQANDPGRLHRLLDAGVEGVICPMINNKKECEDFVSACLYPPHGTRSFGPTRAKLTDPEYFLKANDNIIKLAMIETKSGLDNLDDILSVDKLDGVFIGPNDLALGLGRTPANDPTDPVVVEAIEKIRMAAIAANKKAGIFCGTAEAAQIMAAQGFHMVCPGSDLGHLMSSYRKTLQNLTTAGGA